MHVSHVPSCQPPLHPTLVSASSPATTPTPSTPQGYISGASYSSAKKTVLVLFINGRAVECGPLRRALEGAYAALLPKAARPWALLDLRLPPRHVEVNLHPTKREVGFMHQVGASG